MVFTRRSDAIAALKRYNNVQLDGKTMKIEVIGMNLGLPVTPRVNVVGGTNGRGKRTVVMTYVALSHNFFFFVLLCWLCLSYSLFSSMIYLCLFYFVAYQQQS